MNHFQEAGTSEQIGSEGEEPDGRLCQSALCIRHWRTGRTYSSKRSARSDRGGGQLTFRRSGRIAVVTGGAMDTHEDKQLRDPEDRVIDDCNQKQRRDKAMDKTLADSFPASDPSAWQS
jgi:hypothetical protein